MSDETKGNVSAWTPDLLHAHVVSLLEDRDRIYRDARDADLRNVASIVHTIETRFDGMDKANDVLSTTVNRVPTDVDRQVGQLKAVHDEHFKSIEASIADLIGSMRVRFEERDTRSEREARDNKIAVDAAFAAAKEAVAENNKSSQLANDKTEASFTKQIDAQSRAVDSKFKATDDKIDDLKTRLDSGEGVGKGQANSTASAHWLIGVAVTATAVIISLAYLIVFIVTKG